jgi:hypothetical protein
MGLLGIASGQNKKVPLAATPPVSIGPAGSVTKLEPVILTRASLDEKVITLRLNPLVATAIRMPETVNSVVVGDPENFQAEHSEHEPELVTVKPVATGPVQTNLLITTTLGHQVNLLPIGSGQQNGGTQTVDVLLKYGQPTGGGFLVEENPFSASLIAETQRFDMQGKAPEAASNGAPMASLAALTKTASIGGSGGIDEKSTPVLDKLLDRQKQAALPVLYGQHPRQIDAGPRVKAGVIDVGELFAGRIGMETGERSCAHWLDLNDLHLALAKNRLLMRWTPASEICSQNDLTQFRYAKDYDAVVAVECGGKEIRFGIEYERKPKTYDTYRRIASKLGGETLVDTVLYLVSNYHLLCMIRGSVATKRVQVCVALFAEFMDRLLATPVMIAGTSHRDIPFQTIPCRRARRADGNEPFAVTLPAPLTLLCMSE